MPTSLQNVRLVIINPSIVGAFDDYDEFSDSFLHVFPDHQLKLTGRSTLIRYLARSTKFVDKMEMAKLRKTILDGG